jgi:hypothetical protein
MEETDNFYHEMLGFDLTGKAEYRSDQALLDPMNAPAGAEYRENPRTFRGTNARVVFHEIRNVPRKKFHLRIYAPERPRWCFA